jgi:hypothetical protein
MHMHGFCHAHLLRNPPNTHTAYTTLNTRRMQHRLHADDLQYKHRRLTRPGSSTCPAWKPGRHVEVGKSVQWWATAGHC